MDRYLCIILFFLMYIGNPPKILAQPTNISGLVMDLKNNPLPGANIYLEGTYEGASSDAQGLFTFNTNKTGNYILIIDYLGYGAFKKEIQLEGDDIKVEIRLVESFDQLKAVTIRAGTFEASDSKKSVILKPLDIVTTAGALGDIPGALQTLPGTSPVGESGRLFVRGGHSSETQTYIDGTLVQEPYTSSSPNTAVRGRFNPFMFSGTIFSTGGYSAEFGQALSSVLLLKTKGLQQEDQLDISVLSIGGGLAGTKLWGNGAVTASFDYMNLAPYMMLAPQNLDWIHPPVSYNGALSIRQKTGSDGLLRAYITYDQSNSSLNQEDPDFPGGISRLNLTNRYIYFNTSWLGSLKNNWSLKTGFSGTRNRDTNDFEFGNFNQTLIGTNLKIVLVNQIHQKIKILFGSEYSYENFNLQNRSDSFNMLEDHHLTNQIMAGFIETDIHFSNKLMVRIGSRYEYSALLKKHNLAPRLSAAIKLNANSQISLAYGSFYQDPDNEHLIHSSNLNFENASHYILNYQWVTDDRTFRIELFSKNYKNLVKYNTIESDLRVNQNNRGWGYAYGIDLFWRDRKSIPNGDYWVSYSYLDTKRNYEDFPNEAIPTFASKHSISLVYKHWIAALRSQLGMTVKYASPRVYNDPNTIEFNTRKMDPFRTVNMNWSFLIRQNIILYAAITNIFGFKHMYGYNYATTPDSSGHYNSLPVLPAATRFYFIGCFITLTKGGESNQLNTLE